MIIRQVGNVQRPLVVLMLDGNKERIIDNKVTIDETEYYVAVSFDPVKVKSLQAKIWSKENPQRRYELDKQYREKNRDKINRQARERLQKLKKNPKKYAEYCEKQRLKNRRNYERRK